MPAVTPDSIAAAATRPAKAAGDNQSAEIVPIPDQIAAAIFAANNSAAGSTGRRSPWRAAVTARAVPPGAVGGCTS